MRLLVWVLLVSITFFSCTTMEEKRQALVPEEPKNIIDDSTFIDLMVELEIAEAILNQNPNKIPNRVEFAKAVYDTVFTKMNINPDDFLATHRYYYSLEGKLRKLYDEVLKELQKRNAEMMGTKEENEKIKD